MESLALVCASIDAAINDFIRPPKWRESELDNNGIRALVTELGLSFSLVTQWTAFTAVSKTVYNRSPEDLVKTDVPLPMVGAVPGTAYPRRGRSGQIPGGSPLADDSLFDLLRMLNRLEDDVGNAVTHPRISH